MYLRKILLTSIAAMIFAVPGFVWAGSLEIQDVAISTGVHERVPTGISSSFDASVGKLYAFTRIVGAEGDTRVYHKWYRGDELVADISLPVQGSDWRTWSSKTVLSDWTGDWRVVIVSEDGSILGSVKFAVN